MTAIYTAEIVQEVGNDKMDILRCHFSDEVLNRLNKSPTPGHYEKRVTSRLMLIRIFKALGLATSGLKRLYYNRQGKLIMDAGEPNISISYSTGIVVCVASSSKVGIDVEDTGHQPEARCVDLLEKLTKRRIRDKTDFYSLWTQIESIAKLYDDKGLTDIFFGDLLSERHHTKQFLLKNKYMISLSSNKYFDVTGRIKTLVI